MAYEENAPLPGSGVRSHPVVVARGLTAFSPGWQTFYEYGGYAVSVEATAIPADGDTPGRFVCSELVVQQMPGGPPVTLAGIRSLPVAEMTARVGVQNLLRDEHMRGPMPEGLGKGGPTDEALEWTALWYRFAAVTGEAPAKVLAETMGLTASTSSRWVSLARKRGYLGPSPGAGRVGG